MTFILQIALLSAFAIPSTAQQDSANRTANPSITKAERDLRARLEWEILWAQTPRGFHLPEGGSASVAVYSTTSSLAYCSRALGTCAEYRVIAFQLGWPFRTMRVAAQTDDMEALRVFSKTDDQPRSAASGAPDRGISFGQRRGLLAPGGMLWSTTVALDRGQIIGAYRAMRPEGLAGLKAWLLATMPPTAGYREISIPCFSSKDPEVYLFGDRPDKGPIVFAVQWDRETEEWRDGGVRGPEDRSQIAAMKSTIDSIVCATVKFE